MGSIKFKCRNEGRFVFCECSRFICCGNGRFTKDVATETDVVIEIETKKR